jgi:hypothetical protein
MRRPARLPARQRAVGVALIAAVTACGCSLLLDFDPNLLLETTPERCRDGVDNDQNGLADCAEVGCQAFDFCQERSAEACQDRVDNDRDGEADCHDPGCAQWAPCNESLQDGCADGLDNNENGLVDCQDDSCRADPHCCTLVAQQLADAFEAPSDPALVRDCDETQAGSEHNAFDASRWSSFGVPAPKRTADGEGFDPNRCAGCFQAGTCAPCRDAALLSTSTFGWRSGLEVAARLHVGPGPRDRAGVALTWQSTVEEAPDCAGDAPPLDRVVGISLVTRDATSGNRIHFVVDNQVEHEVAWDASAVAVFLRYDADGFARFYLGADLDPFPSRAHAPTYRSARPLPESDQAARLLVHGNGAGLRVSAVRVRDGGRCRNPVPIPRPAQGEGRFLTPGAPGQWDDGVVADPAVVWWRDAHHLFYTGRRRAGGRGAIGHARWTGDATAVEKVPAAEAVLTPQDVRNLITREQPDRLLEGELDLYGPSALVPVGRGGETLLLYFTVAERVEDRVGRTWIMGVRTEDFQRFEPLVRTLTHPAGAQTLELLSPKQGTSGSWERGVSNPTVVQRGPGDFVMLYTGRSDPADPFTAALGLATSPDGVHWSRDNLQPPGDPLATNQPVVAPPDDALLQTGISDPTLWWDPDLEVFRLWYVLREGADFSIVHATAGRDGRQWVLFPHNPVLRPTSGTWCDDRYLDGPAVLREGDGRLRLWYHGRSEAFGHAICYADNGLGG